MKKIMDNKLEIVKQLNAELHEKFGEQEFSFGYTTDGYCEMIDFGNMPIWNSEMDDRELDETKNEYEPFEPYIKKEFDKLVDKLFSLNFGINSAPTAPIGEAQKPKLSDVLLEIKQILESPMSNRSAIEAIQELHNKIIKQLNNN